MTRLQQLHDEQDQSPWLDDLTRTYLRDGTLETYVRNGIRGVTTNPTILARAIEGSRAYDEQLGRLASAGDATTAYWDLVIEDVPRGNCRSCERPMTPVEGPTASYPSKWPPSWHVIRVAQSPPLASYTCESTSPTYW